MNIIIAIDGHSSCGKSTVAKSIAKKLGYVYVDTGAMYRAVTYFALQQHLINNGIIDETQLLQRLNEIEITFNFDSEQEKNVTFLNGINVEDAIRGIEVSNQVSNVSKIAEVRQKLVSLQREIGEQKSLVMDGRDIGTVVFPNANVKFFMTAAPEVRAKRRFDELQAKGETISFEEILQNVTQRDFIDSNRTESPLIQAKDAIVVDNSDLTREEQLEYMLSKITEKCI